MASFSAGLYLGTENADLVVLRGSFQKPSLISFARGRLPPEEGWRSTVRAEETASPAQTAEAALPGSPLAEEVTDSLRSLFQKVGLPSPRILTAIASEAVVIRYFQMPTIPAHERKQAVAFEAKKYLPFKLEDLISDFQAVIQRTDPSLMRVMFFGLKKSSLSVVLSLFERLHLAPVCLEAAPMSLLRLVRQTGQLPSGHVAAILSVERDTATISIAREDLLYLTRNVSIVGTTSPESEEPSAELLEALINETRVSVDYYRRRFLGEPGVSKVILYSKGFDSKKVEELSRALDIPVEMGDPFRRIAGAKEVPLGLAVATGIALRGLEKRGGQVNLLPPEYRRELVGTLRPLTLEAVAATLVLGLLYRIGLVDLGSQEQKIRLLRQGQILPEAIRPGMPLPELRVWKDKQEKRLRFLAELAKERDRTKPIFSELARVLPEGAWLTYALWEEAFQQTKEIPSPTQRSRLLHLVGSSYLNNRDQELEGINRFLSTLRSNNVFQSSFNEFQLDAVQRSLFQEEEVTEFRLSCATDPETLKSPLKAPRRQERQL